MHSAVLCPPLCRLPPSKKQQPQSSHRFLHAHHSTLPQLRPALATAWELFQQHPCLAAAAAVSDSSPSRTQRLHASQQEQQPHSWMACYCGQALPCSSSSRNSRSLMQRPPAHSRTCPRLGCHSSAGQHRGSAADATTSSTSTSSAAEAVSAEVEAGSAAALAQGGAHQPGRQPQQQHARAGAQVPSTASRDATTITATTTTIAATNIASSSRSAALLRAAPIRPAVDALTAQQLQQQQQQQPQGGRLLSWRSKKSSSSRQPQQATFPPSQQQLPPVPPLEPTVDDATGRMFLTSPVSVVAATTSTRRLAHSLADAFSVHQHQLLFAVGPVALAASMKALATAHNLLTAQDASSASAGAGPGLSAPALTGKAGHQQALLRKKQQQQQQQQEEAAAGLVILMQPTLRGRSGRPATYSYALDITRVSGLPLAPGAASNANIVHITSCSNEQQAARSLVENMPARGQTVLRVAGPYATETAVLAVALARPLMRQRWGQDLAVCVLWNENRAYNGRQTGLLLSVFRCVEGSFPPQVLVMPASARQVKRAQYWEQRQQQKQQRRQAAEAVAAGVGTEACAAAAGSMGVEGGQSQQQQQQSLWE